MKILTVLLTLLCAALVGCASTREQLRGMPPTEEVLVSAPIDCLYAKAVERIGTYQFQEKPVYWNMHGSGQLAWFRIKESAIELESVSAGGTVVRRMQSSYARGNSLKNAIDLMNYLRSNPCEEST